MNSIYAISYMVQEKNMDIVITKDIRNLPELVQIEEEQFWRLCLVSDLSNMEETINILSLRSGKIIYNNKFLYEILKATDLKINDFLKDKLEKIFNELRLSMEEFIPTIFGEEYKEEIKNIIDIFRGKHLWGEKVEKRFWSKCLENEDLNL